MNKYVIKIILGIFVIMITESLHANDLGIVGQTYPIIEEDFLVFLQHRIQKMEESGELKSIQNKFRDRVAKNSDRPHSSDTISKTTQDKVWIYDPSLTIPHDLTDDKDRVFA